LIRDCIYRNVPSLNEDSHATHQKNRSLAVLAVILACALPALAGAAAPCVKAVSSNNGDFLVMSDIQLEPARGNIARVRQMSLQVYPRENFINAKDKIISSATYWTDFVQWV
jgi:hypothetical protein